MENNFKKNLHYRVFVVTVTYGDRFQKLKTVIETVLQQGVFKVIIVDNYSNKASQKGLYSLKKTMKDKIKVIKLPANMGSAYGYKVGIEAAIRDSSCDFVWLLDDDNKPLENALNKLKLFWNRIKMEKKNRRICLCSFRIDRPFLKHLVLENNLGKYIEPKNNHRGFHILFELEKRIMKLKKARKGYNKSFGLIPVAIYGGMFFHEELIEVIGLPDDRFFLYADDTEFSYRITKTKGFIILLEQSQVIDLEKSWGMKYGRFGVFSFFISISLEKRLSKIYFNTRNRIIFEKRHLITNKLVFLSNFLIVTFFVIIFCLLMLNIRNLLIYLRAISDGFKEQYENYPELVKT